MPDVRSVAFLNADIRTMSPTRSREQAVLIVDGIVDAVGSTANISAAAEARGLRTVDLGGRTVLPGFVDVHTHIELASYSLSNWPDAHTPPFSSLEEVGRYVSGYLAAHPGDDLLIVRSSFGMHRRVREGRLFTRAELDAISPVRPLMVAAGLHVMSMNTSAMELVGVFDLVDSSERIIHRDAEGTPTGVVTEVLDLLPFFDEAKLAAALREHVPTLATRNGVTTIGSIALNPGDADLIAGLIDDGLPLRLRSYSHVPRTATLDEVIAAGVSSRRSVPVSGIGGVKIFVDGQHGDGIDAVFDDPKWTPDELDAFVAKASAAGIQVIMHAVSTMAVRMALDAIEKSSTEPGNPMRHRIEHGGDYIEGADIARAADIGALLVTTPHFIASTEGESSAPGVLLKSIIRAGVGLSAGTDTTGTVPEGAAPLYNVACAMNRAASGGQESDESLTFEEAVALFTSSAAYAMFEEGSRGSIQPGMFGDLVVLDRAVDDVVRSVDFFDIAVAATVFGGHVVYESQPDRRRQVEKV